MVAGMMGHGRYVVHKKEGNIALSHNSLGFRGGEFTPHKSSTRVVTVGGSTTYGVEVSDTETWPARLGQKLGQGYEVLNLGVAGHGTAEHLYMVGAVVSRLQPDVVILHIGLNDMHCMHSPEITPLLNKCHSDLVFLSTGQCYMNKLPRLATIHALVSTMQNAGFAPQCPKLAEGKTMISTIDAGVLEDFRARSTALVAAAKALNARVVIVPQVGFQQAEIARGSYRWWTPYLDQSALTTLLKSFNAELKQIAQRTGVSYVDAVDEVVWSDDLFVDASHLNGKGNERLASMIVPQVQKVAPVTGD
jgi:lysophospholipase L1-like esterase